MYKMNPDRRSFSQGRPGKTLKETGRIGYLGEPHHRAIEYAKSDLYKSRGRITAGH